jgi:hypothetical protein
MIIVISTWRNEAKQMIKCVSLLGLGLHRQEDPKNSTSKNTDSKLTNRRSGALSSDIEWATEEVSTYRGLDPGKVGIYCINGKQRIYENDNFDNSIENCGRWSLLSLHIVSWEQTSTRQIAVVSSTYLLNAISEPWIMKQALVLVTEHQTQNVPVCKATQSHASAQMERTDVYGVHDGL